MKLSIPNQLSDITLDQFRRIEKIADDGSYQWVAEALTILTDLTIEQVSLLTVDEIEKIGDILNGLWNSTDQEAPLLKKIEYKGQRLGFHPNLSDITIGEWADLESLLEQGWLGQMGSVLSILYRPIVTETKFEYSITPYKGYGEDAEEHWGEITMDVVLGAVGFFLHTATVLANSSRSYSMAQAEALYSATNGAGIRSFTRWLRVTLYKLKRRLN